MQKTISLTRVGKKCLSVSSLSKSFCFNFRPLFQYQILYSNIHFSAASYYYEKKRTVPDTEYSIKKSDFKLDCTEMFISGVKAVHPLKLIKQALNFDRQTSLLKVENEQYYIDRNVYVVGMGKAVVGMARAVEDVLGEDVVTGILSVPEGIYDEMISSVNR